MNEDELADAVLQRAIDLKETMGGRLRTYANVTGVGVGYKEVAGKRTKRLALRVYVSRKVPKQELLPEEVLPEEVGGVPVDVIEAAFTIHQGSTSPADHQARHNPLLGGISIINVNLGVGAGTLGGSVFDNVTAQDMILSNWHVLCGSATCANGEAIIQPGSLDSGTAGDLVARLERSALTDKVDGALGRLTGDRFLLRRILGLGAFSGIADPGLGLAVKKSGRTTGVTAGSITDVSADITVDGYPGGSHDFRTQIVIEDGEPSLPGDSGSLWLDEANSVVGLNFAGSPGRAVANPFRAVLAALNINVARGVTMQDFVAMTSVILQ